MTRFREHAEPGGQDLAATMLLLCGLGMLLALLIAGPEDMTRDPPSPAAPGSEGAILASCMNGQRISVSDGYVLTCRIKKVRM